MSLLVDGDGVVMPMPNKEEFVNSAALAAAACRQCVGNDVPSGQRLHRLISSGCPWVNAFQHSILREKIHIQNVGFWKKIS